MRAHMIHLSAEDGSSRWHFRCSVHYYHASDRLRITSEVCQACRHCLAARRVSVLNMPKSQIAALRAFGADPPGL